MSLQAKRRELIGQIAEGRSVIATLRERHAAMGRKIEEASTGLHRLEEQLAALNTVMTAFDQEALVVAAEPAPPPPALRTVQPEPAPAPAPAVTGPARRDRFRPMEYLRCVSEGHQMVNSRTQSGYMTCTRCRVRRRM